MTRSPNSNVKNHRISLLLQQKPAQTNRGCGDRTPPLAICSETPSYTTAKIIMGNKGRIARARNWHTTAACEGGRRAGKRQAGGAGPSPPGKARPRRRQSPGPAASTCAPPAPAPPRGPSAAPRGAPLPSAARRRGGLRAAPPAARPTRLFPTLAAAAA